MIKKIGAYQNEVNPRTVLHIALAISIGPLLGLKIAIARKIQGPDRKSGCFGRRYFYDFNGFYYLDGRVLLSPQIRCSLYGHNLFGQGYFGLRHQAGCSFPGQRAAAPKEG